MGNPNNDPENPDTGDDIDPVTGLPRNQTPTTPPVTTQPVPVPKLPDPTTPPGVPSPTTTGPATPGVQAPSPVGYNPGKASATLAAHPNDPTSAIDLLYQKYGVQDNGRGSGFTDRAYWLEHPDQILNGRLEADLAGTGSDNPEGTPGSGPWQNSGRNQPNPQARPTTTGPSAKSPTPLQQMPPGFWDPTQGGMPSFPGMPSTRVNVGSPMAFDTSSITDSPVIRQLILSLLGGGVAGANRG